MFEEVLGSVFKWFQAEVNEAWKVKASPDPTVLPKGKSQAKYASLVLLLLKTA